MYDPRPPNGKFHMVAAARFIKGETTCRLVGGPMGSFLGGSWGDALLGYLCDIRVWATADLHLPTGNATDGLQCGTLSICVNFFFGYHISLFWGVMTIFFFPFLNLG